MAQSLETIRNRATDSIKGRKLGFDLKDETLNGIKDIRRAVQDLTSASTATALLNYGVVNIAGTSLLTSAQVFLLSNPIPGVMVTINNVRSNATAGTSGSTVISIDRPSTAFYIESSEASSGVAIQLNEAASITLMGNTTAKYTVIARSGIGAAVVATS